jgi:hypothetical protein
MMNRYALLAFLLAGVVAPSGLHAEQSAPPADGMAGLKSEMAELRRQIEEQRQAYESQIEQLRREVKDLAGRAAAPSAPSPEDELAAAIEAARKEAAAAEPGALSLFIRPGTQSFNPDISVIGDMLGHYVSGEHGERRPTGEHENEDRFQFRELELAFSSPVDPHSRADFFVHLHEHDGEWHAGLCEGYLTLLTLPHDLQARVGKFRSAFGKANQLHTHNMPWVDRPNVITNFFGEEGMSEEGAELSWLIPNPWKKYVEWTLEVQNNTNPHSFGGGESDVVMFVNHLKYFENLSPASTLELGASHATGPNDAGHGGSRTHIWGLDTTYKWRPPREGLYKSLTWQTEALFSQKDQPDGATEHSWGAYSSVEYQFARQWSAFTRWDYSQFPDDTGSYEHAGSVGVTFAQSEYCFWRLSYKYTDASGPLATENRSEVWLQLNIGLGPHRAHKY